MSQRSNDQPASSTASSSFPISSPSFWAEAAKATYQAAEPHTPVKHVLRDERGEGDGPEAKKIQVGAAGSGRVKKRARFDPELEEDLDEDQSGKNTADHDHLDAFDADLNRRQNSTRTNLSYLPNRLVPLDPSDPHAYLANPEYAPNRFGDIGDYMRKKEIKVQNQNRDIALASASSDLPQIFTGLSFYINGNTHPPMEELRKLILQRGGEVRPYLRSKGMVKFIIAPMLTQSKFREFEKYRVVREGWIVESCAQGKVLDWSKWKLQVQGGWEESGRKGLQGFLAGTSQKATQREGVDRAEQDKSGGEADDYNRMPDLPSIPTSPLRSSPPIPTVNPSAAAQSLFRPPKPAPIPISPGQPVGKPGVPPKSPAPNKTQRPEGAWEHYYTKEANEEAARMMRDSEWRSKNTAERGNENGYIDGYYQNSRLHHLATWKSELRVLVAAAQSRSESLALTRPSLSSSVSVPTSALSLSNAQLPRMAGAGDVDIQSREKVIFHVDFDAFFVSCGLATRPELRGKPAVVCHSTAKGENSTSEIASASYEARAKGVKNGMSLGRATQLVGNDLKTIPYEFETYKKFSLAFYTVLMGYADQLQAVSIDEALIDVTTAVGAIEIAPEDASVVVTDNAIRDPAVELAEKIRSDVRNETGCEVSIGISHNILLAKLATRRAKPAGAHRILPEAIPDFLAPLDVDDLPSIGHSTRNKIEEKFNSTKCGELLVVTKDAFKRLLGPKTGDTVWGYLRGVDSRKLEPDKERKSISAEMNYGIRFRTQEQAETYVRDLAAEVSKRMKEINVRGRLLTLKLMTRHPDAPIEPPKFLGHGWCETSNRSATIGKNGAATDDSLILGNESVKLLQAMRPDPVELRGVGIQVTKLDSESGTKVIERDPGQPTLKFVPKIQSTDRLVQRRINSDPPGDERSVLPVAAPAKPEIDDNESEIIQISPSPSPPGPRSPTPTPIAGPSRLLVPTASSEGIDPDFLAALPLELQEEVKRDHAQTRAAVKRRAAEKIGKESAVPEVEVVSNQPGTSTGAGKHAAAHITRQLRPKLKTQLKATAVAELPLYGAWARAGTEGDNEAVMSTAPKTKVDIDKKVGKYSVSEIEELGLDPEVFGQLPDDVQIEVISQERERHRHRKLLHRPADTSRLRVRERERRREASTTTSVSPPSHRSPSIPPGQRRVAPSIVRPCPTRPALFSARSSEEVMATVRKWIDSRATSGPAKKDADKVGAYLRKCMGKEGGVGGVGDVVDVLRYMRSVLKEVVGIDEVGELGEWEGQGEREGEREGRDVETMDRDEQVRRMWWETWWRFKADVDKIAVATLGAPLKV